MTVTKMIISPVPRHGKTEAMKRLRREIMLRHPEAFIFDDDGNILAGALAPENVITIQAVTSKPRQAICGICRTPMVFMPMMKWWECSIGHTVTEQAVYLRRAWRGA